MRSIRLSILRLISVHQKAVDSHDSEGRDKGGDDEIKGQRRKLRPEMTGGIHGKEFCLDIVFHQVDAEAEDKYGQCQPFGPFAVIGEYQIYLEKNKGNVGAVQRQHEPHAGIKIRGQQHPVHVEHVQVGGDGEQAGKDHGDTRHHKTGGGLGHQIEFHHFRQGDEKDDAAAGVDHIHIVGDEDGPRLGFVDLADRAEDCLFHRLLHGRIGRVKSGIMGVGDQAEVAQVKDFVYAEEGDGQEGIGEQHCFAKKQAAERDPVDLDTCKSYLLHSLLLLFLAWS